VTYDQALHDREEENPSSCV